MSSAIPDQRAISLQPIYDAAANCPLVIANDMQALAVRWMLTHRAEITNDVLLVGFVDGSMGAAMLLEGRPNKGCVMACNELGHTPPASGDGPVLLRADGLSGDDLFDLRF